PSSRGRGRPIACPAQNDALQPGAPPRFADQIVVNLQQPPEFARTPMRAAVRRRLPRLVEDPCFHRWGQHRRLASVPRLQSLEAFGEKSSPSSIDGIAVTRDGRFGQRVRGAIGQHQNHARAARVLGADLEAPEATFKLGFVHRRSMSAPFGATVYQYYFS